MTSHYNILGWIYHNGTLVAEAPSDKLDQVIEESSIADIMKEWEASELARALGVTLDKVPKDETVRWAGFHLGFCLGRKNALNWPHPLCRCFVLACYLYYFVVNGSLKWCAHTGRRKNNNLLHEFLWGGRFPPVTPSTVEPQSYEPLGIFEVRNCAEINGVLMGQSSCVVNWWCGMGMVMGLFSEIAFWLTEQFVTLGFITLRFYCRWNPGEILLNPSTLKPPECPF